MRNTKQKNIILDVLQNDKSHPTIANLYEKVQKVDSTIGQATVYRNVNKLVLEGKARRVPDLNGIDHYDGDMRVHYHLFCKSCSKIIDLFDEDFSSTIKKIESKYSIEVDDMTILLDGICEGCNAEV